MADLREPRPKGAKQFAPIVKTKMTGKASSKRPGAASKPNTVKGFSATDIDKLKKTEKRYAASRRAATAGGRETLYD